jgi:hypothetical protein
MIPAAAALRSFAHRTGSEIMGLATWWISELRETWLEFFERIAPNRARRFLVEIDKDTGVVRQIGNATSTPLQSFSLDGRGGLPALREFWTEGAPGRARAFVALPESSVLICKLQLPPVRDRDVGRVVDLRLERELPLPADQLYVDWEVTERHADRSRTVSVAIARRSDVDRLRDAIQSWGWNVFAIGLSGGGNRLRFNLMPKRPHVLDLTIGKREWLLVASAAVLCALYCVTVLGQWWFERSRLAGALDEARTQMAAIHRRQVELDSLSQPLVALGDLMKSKSAVEALTAMSSVIPADTWVYQTEIRQNEVRAPAAAEVLIKLEAYTPAATTLIGLLQGSDEFEQVQLVETASAGLGTASDRVELTARLRGVGPQ